MKLIIIWNNLNIVTLCHQLTTKTGQRETGEEITCQVKIKGLYLLSLSPYIILLSITINGCVCVRPGYSSGPSL